MSRAAQFAFKVGGPPVSMLDRAGVNPCRMCGSAPFLTRSSQRILTLLCESDAHRMEVSGWPMKAAVELWNACNPVPA
jgi:hypothetical protein